MSESKDLTNRELQIWLEGKFAAVDERLDSVDRQFKSVEKQAGNTKWTMGILFAIALSVIGGIGWYADKRIDRLEDRIWSIKECPCGHRIYHENNVTKP